MSIINNQANIRLGRLHAQAQRWATGPGSQDMSNRVDVRDKIWGILSTTDICPSSYGTVWQAVAIIRDYTGTSVIIRAVRKSR